GTLIGLLGSRALAGTLTRDELAQPRGGREALITGLRRAGLFEDGLLSSKRRPESLAGYLELHIEQGSRLLKAEAQIGVVSGIVGICSYRLTFSGRADHAGTTPMDGRLDAGQGAAAFILAVRRLVIERFPGCVANIGRVDFEPGAFNIVPERARLALEFRAADSGSFRRLETALLALAEESALRYGLGLEFEFLGKHPPAPMSETVQKTIAATAESLGLKHIPLSSGAGHDAQSLAPLCPAGMLFVPSQGGASHSAREMTEWNDCVNGANVLLGAAIRMALGK
ncbi:hydantoinase/carbamoylase family amidase, partial [Chloroflexota bacterium]